MKGLVIDEPWISLILGRKKTWEMRSTHTQVRGRIALIRKGSGTVVGLADLTESLGPLDEIAWRAHRERHQIPLEKQQETARWNTAWLLEHVQPLSAPVRYDHPNGAVVWVNLSDETAAALQVANQAPVHSEPLEPATSAKRRVVPRAALDRAPVKFAGSHSVPVARDGSWFSPDLARASRYTVGAKGEEEVFGDYFQALARLQSMSVPRWRRPNAEGNWGIVAGIEWKSIERLE